MDTQTSATIVGQRVEIDPDWQSHSQLSFQDLEKDSTISSAPTPPSSEEVTRTEGAYILSPPTTATEAARLDVQHTLWGISLGGRLHVTALDPLRAYKVSYLAPLS